MRLFILLWHFEGPTMCWALVSSLPAPTFLSSTPAAVSKVTPDPTESPQPEIPSVGGWGGGTDLRPATLSPAPSPHQWFPRHFLQLTMHAGPQVSAAAFADVDRSLSLP